MCRTISAWNSPDFGVAADFSNALVKRPFATLAEYAKATGQERHSVLVDYKNIPQGHPARPG